MTQTDQGTSDLTYHVFGTQTSTVKPAETEPSPAVVPIRPGVDAGALKEAGGVQPVAIDSAKEVADVNSPDVESVLKFLKENPLVQGVPGLADWVSDSANQKAVVKCFFEQRVHGATDPTVSDVLRAIGTALERQGQKELRNNLSAAVNAHQAAAAAPQKSPAPAGGSAKHDNGLPFAQVGPSPQLVAASPSLSSAIGGLIQSAVGGAGKAAAAAVNGFQSLKRPGGPSTHQEWEARVDPVKDLDHRNQTDKAFNKLEAATAAITALPHNAKPEVRSEAIGKFTAALETATRYASEEHGQTMRDVAAGKLDEHDAMDHLELRRAGLKGAIESAAGSQAAKKDVDFKADLAARLEAVLKMMEEMMERVKAFFTKRMSPSATTAP